MLVVGLGMRPGVARAAIVSAVRDVLGDAALHSLATIDRRAGEPGLVAAAAELGVPVIAFTAAELAEVDVPNPAARVLTALGTASVAEAAALRFGGELVVSKRTVDGVVVAAADMPPSAPFRQ